MSWGEMYGKGRIRSLVAHTWPAAPEIPGDAYGSRWKSMSRFERVCWAWSTLNAYALGTVESSTDAQIFRFEDIFESQDRGRYLEDMVEFLTTFHDYKVSAVGSLEGWLDRRVHHSTWQFPHWQEWSVEQRTLFKAICGPLMRELGYGTG
jgi:hypothetical protein